MVEKPNPYKIQQGIGIECMRNHVGYLTKQECWGPEKTDEH